MSEKTEIKIFDPTILTTHDLICLATVRSYDVEYGNFVRSQKNNKIIYTFDDKKNHSNTLPNMQYIIFPDQEVKPQDNQWVMGFSRSASQDSDLVSITKLLDILDVEYKLDSDSILDTQVIDTLTVKTKTIEALSAIINLYENAIPEVQMSLIIALKEMIKWESNEIIDIINTKVAAWLSLAERALSKQNTLNLLALPNERIEAQECDRIDEYSDELTCSSDPFDADSSVYFYNLISSNTSTFKNQSEALVTNNELKIISEYTILCKDNSQVNPMNFIEGKDSQLYLTIEKLVVDLRTQEMLTKYTIEQLKHLLAVKIHNNCYTDVPKFALERKEYLEKFNKYVQHENAEGSSSWRSGFSHATKHIKVWFGVGSSFYDAGVMLSWIGKIEDGPVVLKCGKFIVSSLLAISLVTSELDTSAVDNTPKNSILKNMACKLSLCKLAANEDLNDHSLKQLATFLNSFVNKYFAKNNVLLTNQADTSQLLLGQLSNQTLLSDIGMDKYLGTVLKTVSGEDVPLLKMVAYNATECQDYIANSLTGLSSILESASVSSEI